ncbi:MAG: alanine dehydrogenase [Sterolibacterium sp.]|jgi:alanine dehydrogenase|nr:alanine dehydrogenase [Sterolibacterium sp.]
MIIGCPREIKNHEYRVGLTPAGVHALVQAGHEVRIEQAAGTRAGFSDAAYTDAGAVLAKRAATVYQADLLIKVKELQPAELDLTVAGQIIFSYQHLAPDPQLTHRLLAADVSCIAYETVTDGKGNLPLLAPMSRIAGRLAPQVGAWALQMAHGGSGVLLGGVPGVPAGRVVVLGAGSVGAHATQIAVGMGADVTVIDQNIDRLAALDSLYRGRIQTLTSEALTRDAAICEADLVIGAVLIPGKLAPRLISRSLLSRMRPGSVIVDVAIDQGGVSATSRPTTHDHPLFIEEGIVHYCVSNMPAAVSRTATLALTQATLPATLALANLGLKNALAADPGLAAGLQIHAGQITHAGLAQELGLPLGALP